ncbi:MAG: cytochrome c [Rhodospirillales bacterium]|nr:cytochrome c [Rhodospirillales bacterium]
MRIGKTTLIGLIGVLVSAAAIGAEDTRQLVKMPEMMQSHMMQNMRDHLLALDELLGLLSKGKVSEAGWVAEKKIGLSSLELHGSSHLGPYMPEGMRIAGTEMHRAASRFAQAAQEADITHTYEAQQKVFEALQGITQNCNACHTAYRLR